MEAEPTGAKALLLAPFWRYTVRCMPSIQVKDVPHDVHSTLRRRAAAAGQSLQEYLLARLVQDAQTPTLDELLDRAGAAPAVTPVSRPPPAPSAPNATAVIVVDASVVVTALADDGARR